MKSGAGVFLCMSLECSAEGLPLTYSQSNVEAYRVRMAMSILQGRVVD